MRLNLGCGHRVADGWYNVDIEHNPKAPRAPELLCDLKKIPLVDGCADTIRAIHVFEHFYRWECEGVLKEWGRLLKPGGLMILELPDLIKCCKNIIKGREGRHKDQLGRWGLYGDPRDENKYMCHPWGWAPEELMSLLQDNGFKDTKHLPTEFHSCGRDHRDMRIEAVKA